MEIFYYENGFYRDDVHEHIPEGAIKITESEYKSLLNGQSEGKIIVADKNGSPILHEPLPDKRFEIIYELEQVDRSVTARILREAALGDEDALMRIKDVEEQAKELRKKLAQVESI